MYEIFEQLLRRHGISAYKVARETGIGQSTISNWKAKKNLLRPDLAKKLADYFGVSLDYLMTGKESSEVFPCRQEFDLIQDADQIMEKLTNGEPFTLKYQDTDLCDRDRLVLREALLTVCRQAKLLKKK